MIRELFTKYRTVIAYLFFGGLTTLVNLAVYFACTHTFLNPQNPVHLEIATVLSWIVAVAFAYVTNRRYVFASHNPDVKKELASFVMARVGTLLMEMAIMYLGVSVLEIGDAYVKIAAQVIVIVANYIFSRLFVFRKEEPEASQEETR